MLMSAPSHFYHVVYNSGIREFSAREDRPGRCMSLICERKISVMRKPIVQSEVHITPDGRYSWLNAPPLLTAVVVYELQTGMRILCVLRQLRLMDMPYTKYTLLGL